MKKRIIILIVLFLYWLNLTSTLAASGNRRDGNWWRQQQSVSKLLYVTGFFDGMDLGFNFSYWKFPKESYKSDCLEKIIGSYHEYRDKFFSNVTNDQIVDGLDVFYNDFRNRRIFVNDAVWLVVNGIAGTPEKKLQEMIESWRKNVR